MKSYWKKALGMMLAAVLLIGLIPAQTQAAKLSFQKQVLLTAYKTPIRESIIVTGLPAKGRIVKLRSDNRKVLTVSTKYDSEMDAHVIRMKAKKAGRSRVTFTAKKGKTFEKFTCNVTVKKYVNPFRSIKVSGKSIRSRMNRSNIVKLDYRNAKEKVTYKLKKNWELEGAYFDNGDWKEDAILKNLVFEADHGELEMHLVNTVTGQTEICYIRWK